jgi:hypothetical protein
MRLVEALEITVYATDSVLIPLLVLFFYRLDSFSLITFL